MNFWKWPKQTKINFFKLKIIHTHPDVQSLRKELNFKEQSLRVKREFRVKVFITVISSKQKISRRRNKEQKIHVKCQRFIQNYKSKSKSLLKPLSKSWSTCDCPRVWVQVPVSPCSQTTLSFLKKSPLHHSFLSGGDRMMKKTCHPLRKRQMRRKGPKKKRENQDQQQNSDLRLKKPETEWTSEKDE